MFEAQPEKVILTLFRMLDPVPAVVYERHGSTIHVYPIALDRDHLPIRNVTLHYPAGTPFQKVMDALLAGTNIECAWMGSPGVAASGRVDLVNVPFRTALEAVLAQAKLPHGAHIHYVWNGSSLLDLSLRTDLPTSALGRRPITVKAVAMPLRRLLRGTFDLDADYSMEMAPDVTGTVTDSFAGLPLEEALPRVLHHSTVPAEMHVYQGDHRVGTGRIVVIRRGR